MWAVVTARRLRQDIVDVFSISACAVPRHSAARTTISSSYRREGGGTGRRSGGSQSAAGGVAGAAGEAEAASVQQRAGGSVSDDDEREAVRGCGRRGRRTPIAVVGERLDRARCAALHRPRSASYYRARHLRIVLCQPARSPQDISKPTATQCLPLGYRREVPPGRHPWFVRLPPSRPPPWRSAAETGRGARGCCHHHHWCHCHAAPTGRPLTIHASEVVGKEIMLVAHLQPATVACTEDHCATAAT